MSRDEIQKLLGGYATYTLSESERRVLFEAALEDQELFDMLAKEQALREVLRDPFARQQLIAALGPARVPFRWLRRHSALAMAGGLAALLIVTTLVVRQIRHAAHPEAMVADAIAPQPPVAMPPSNAAPRRAPEPVVSAHQPKRLARLPAPQPVATATPSPSPSPTPVPSALAAQAVGALAGTRQAPRQMVQAPASQSLVAQEASPLPVEYALMRMDADGQYQPVPSGTVFHAGDSVRVQVDPRSAGYISLYQRDDATAGWKLVASQRVEQGQRYEMPAGGLQSDMPAKLELLLVLSPVEHVDVDTLATPTLAIEFR